MHLSVGVIFGGVPNGKSLRTVARGLDVLVATPGRLLDLIDQRALSCASSRSWCSTKPTRCSTSASSTR